MNKVIENADLDWPEGATHCINNVFTMWVEGTEFKFRSGDARWVRATNRWNLVTYQNNSAIWTIYSRPTNQSGTYFKTEEELMRHLLDGGTIRPHFKSDETDTEGWIHMKDGNRVYKDSGESAENCLMGLGFWVRA